MVSKIWDWWHRDRQPAEKNRVCVLHFSPSITLSCTKPPCECVCMCVCPPVNLYTCNLVFVDCFLCVCDCRQLSLCFCCHLCLLVCVHKCACNPNEFCDCKKLLCLFNTCDGCDGYKQIQNLKVSQPVCMQTHSARPRLPQLCCTWSCRNYRVMLATH